MVRSITSKPFIKGGAVSSRMDTKQHHQLTLGHRADRCLDGQKKQIDRSLSETEPMVMDHDATLPARASFRLPNFLTPPSCLRQPDAVEPPRSPDKRHHASEGRSLNSLFAGNESAGKYFWTGKGERRQTSGRRRLEILYKYTGQSTGQHLWRSFLELASAVHNKHGTPRCMGVSTTSRWCRSLVGLLLATTGRRFGQR